MFMRNFYKLSFIISVGLFANPSGPAIVQGKAKFFFPDNKTIQIETDNGSIINWADFSISKGELAQFTLPSKQSSCLNRVISCNPSKIFGRLESNGKIYLINPNGILVGESGSIHTNEFIASTLNIKDADFLAGDKLVFSGEEKTAIINHGKIVAKDGSIYLISSHIQNLGSLVAKKDTVGLATGIEVILRPAENTKISIRANDQCFGNIENSGDIEAVITEIKASDNPYCYAINHSGMIIASKNSKENKKIEIDALDQKINIEGTIENSSGVTTISSKSIAISSKALVKDKNKGDIHFRADEFFCNDGTIQTSGGQISIIGKDAAFLNSGLIDCSANKGGTITASVDRYINKGIIKADGQRKAGGIIRIESQKNLVEVAKGLLSAKGNPAGDITLISDRIFTSGRYNIEGYVGGNLHFETPQLLLVGPMIYAGGDMEGGSVQIAKEKNLSHLFINPFTQLNSKKRKAGKIIVHHDERYEFKNIASMKNLVIENKAILKAVDSLPLPDQPQTKLIDPNFGMGTGFGTHVEMLAGGNVVVTKPLDASVTTDNGAVSLFSGTTGALLDVITGSTMGDKVGFNGVLPLATTGNFVVLSPFWINGGTADAGAVTFGAATGFAGTTVTATNSLVGGSASDYVGAGLIGGGANMYAPNVTVLANGNYVVCSPFWDGAAVDVGAATLCDGTAGTYGLVTTANSLIGTTASDTVGIGSKQGDLSPSGYYYGKGAVELTNGNFVVISPYWDGIAMDVGAVTWRPGASVSTGSVMAGTSVTGSTPGDKVGLAGVIALKMNSNFVVCSPFWFFGSSDEGAATWVDESSPTGIVVGPGNSLVATPYMGPFFGPNLGLNNGIALADGNYVVLSSHWGYSGLKYGAGAATYGNGFTGTTGPVTPGITLHGRGGTADYVGRAGIALKDKKYVVLSPDVNNGAGISGGAATWADGFASGFVSVLNSIHGVVPGDGVASGGAELLAGADGDFVVISPSWGSSAGAVTWGDGMTTNAKSVSTLNSIHGTTAGDSVGSGGVVPLSNGKFVISSPDWTNGGAGTDRGAVTVVDPATSIAFAVAVGNSVYGTADSDFVGSGGVKEISGDGYIVASPTWGSDGAVTCGDASLSYGITGTVTSANSLLGTGTDSFADVNVDTTVAFSSTTENYAIGFPSGDTGSNGKVILFGVGSIPPTPPTPAISQLALDKDISKFYRAISEAGQEWNFWPRPYLKFFNVDVPPFGQQKVWCVDNFVIPFEVHEKE